MVVNPGESVHLPIPKVPHRDSEEDPTPPYTPGRNSGKSSTEKGTLKANKSEKLQFHTFGEDDWHDTETPDRLVLTKFTIYETKTRFYIIGANQSDTHFRVLKIDRTASKEKEKKEKEEEKEEEEVVKFADSITEDDVIYTKQEIVELLSMIENGNKMSGGLIKVSHAYGIVGFIRFTKGYYICLITKRSAVALLGGHYVYHIDETRMLAIEKDNKTEANSVEERYIKAFQSVDLTKNFYFSYTYDITHNLQVNMTRHQYAGLPHEPNDPLRKFQCSYNEMFVWNHHLLKAGFDNWVENKGRFSNWILVIIHGFVDQAKISIYGRPIFLTLIARRSRHFAGARFLKRGVSDQGYVANDVETEQIVAETGTTSFHGPEPANHDHRKRLFSSNRYTSHVQHRGSIPLFWGQEGSGMEVKPRIKIKVDPFYAATALHFDNMFLRYNSPIVVLNLVKAKEKIPRESLLLDEYTQAIEYLNQFLPEKSKIVYRAWDMSRAAKSQDQDVIGHLEQIAEESIAATGFFHSGSFPGSNETTAHSLRQQTGVVRTNCIDCLDRTNAAQFVIGKCALGYQLRALGIIRKTSVPFDSDIVNILTEMYHDHGDTIALQYGGSHLVNTMETYRKINQWSSHSRDMIETMRRFYSNNFMDSEKQDAINLFLGNYISLEGRPMLWDLNTDYHLHNSSPRERKKLRSYRKWWTREHIERQPLLVTGHLDESFKDNRKGKMTEESTAPEVELSDPMLYWWGYYRPNAFTDFERLFAFNMNGTMKYWPQKYVQAQNLWRLYSPDQYDFSPFTIRKTAVIVSPPSNQAAESKGVKRWLLGASNKSEYDEKEQQQQREAEIKDAEEKAMQKEKPPPLPWSLEGIVGRALSPSVTSSETKEYKRYINQFKSVNLMARAPNATGERDATWSSHPEYDHYSAYIARTGTRPDLRLQPIDEQVYTTYVDMPRRAYSVQLSRENGYSSSTGAQRNRYDAYAAYLRTGSYPVAEASKQSQMERVRKASTNRKDEQWELV